MSLSIQPYWKAIRSGNKLRFLQTRSSRSFARNWEALSTYWELTLAPAVPVQSF
jgi:hypothetical protein